MLHRKRTLSRRAARRRFLVFLSLAALLLLLSLVAPLLAPHDPTATDSEHMNEGPSPLFPFGTDRYGRCVCSRLLYGARTSIFSAVALVALTFVFGTALGLAAGYFGGVLDTLVLRLAELLQAVPQMVLAIAVAGILGGGMFNAMLAMGITGWTLYARLARAQALTLKEEAYVHAARLSGCSSWTVMTKTLLPNMLGPMLVTAATQIGVMMIGIAGLSFLGIGVTEPQAEWGSMINTSRAYLQLAPWAVLAPAAATILTVMIFNYLGDCLRDYLDVEVAR